MSWPCGRRSRARSSDSSPSDLPESSRANSLTSIRWSQAPGERNSRPRRTVLGVRAFRQGQPTSRPATGASPPYRRKSRSAHGQAGRRHPIADDVRRPGHAAELLRGGHRGSRRHRDQGGYLRYRGRPPSDEPGARPRAAKEGRQSQDSAGGAKARRPRIRAIIGGAGQSLRFDRVDTVSGIPPFGSTSTAAMGQPTASSWSWTSKEASSWTALSRTTSGASCAATAVDQESICAATLAGPASTATPTTTTIEPPRMMDFDAQPSLPPA